MIDGPSIVAAFKECGITHVVWVPDTELGSWEPAIVKSPDLALIRACREGEAIAIACGLMLGGKKPIVLIQCTGMFEAGDALRNVVHDLKLPLFMIVGVRSWYIHQQGSTFDSCPIYAEPIVKAWNIPYKLLTNEHSAADFRSTYRQAQSENRAGAVLLAE